MAMGDGKAKNLIEYLDNLIEKGKATNGSISPLKISFTKVMQTIDGDNWSETEVRSIDVEDYMTRFANLTNGRYAHDSLTVYKSRVNKVIGWYIQFMEKPGWTPDVQRRNRAQKTTITKRSGVPSKNIHVTGTTASTTDIALQPITPISDMPNRVLYPYPLSDGQLIHISLPVKLTKLDAKRIGAFVESIAVDEESTKRST